MRKKIYEALKTIYGILMTISFFGGALPLVAFIVAMIIGGTTGEAIALAMKDHVYPCVIVLASIAVIIGWIAMYVGKKEGLSVKSISASDNDAQDNADDQQDPQ